MMPPCIIASSASPPHSCAVTPTLHMYSPGLRKQLHLEQYRQRVVGWFILQYFVISPSSKNHTLHHRGEWIPPQPRFSYATDLKYPLNGQPDMCGGRGRLRKIWAVAFTTIFSFSYFKIFILLIVQTSLTLGLFYQLSYASKN